MNNMRSVVISKIHLARLLAEHDLHSKAENSSHDKFPQYQKAKKLLGPSK